MQCLPRTFYVAVLFLVAVTATCAEAADVLRVATFTSDITPPLGQPLVGGDVVRTVEQPLLAKGIVLEVGAERYVLCALDWCELCNDSYRTLRAKVATAVGADPSHVALQTVHQHTAPWINVVDKTAPAKTGTLPPGFDPKALDAIEEVLVAAVKRSLGRFEPFDHVGTGQAKVDRVAANRRTVDATGKICTRWSFCADPAVRALPEGIIDPYVKTITLARGQKPLVRLHYYATHPQTGYGDGRASSDIVGDAREKLQRKEQVLQIYFTGCSGDITVGKYNDGSKNGRAELANRLLAGMEASVAATKLLPAGAVRWRTYPLLLPWRSDASSPQDARNRQPIELSSLDIGNVHILHLPGEPMICFQQYAQNLQPADFVAVAGYGDCGPGYLCPEKAFAEGGYEPSASNVQPNSESHLKKAIAALLGVP